MDLQLGSPSWDWTLFRARPIFLLCHFPASGPDAGTLIRGCEWAGLFLRDVRGMGSGFGTHTFRIAVKDAATNGQAVEILRRQLGHSADRVGGGQAGMEQPGGTPATTFSSPFAVTPGGCNSSMKAAADGVFVFGRVLLRRMAAMSAEE